MNLNEHLESVEKGIKAVNDALEPLAQSRSDTTTILRKHAALTADWDAVREESEVLREELKEDKWLTVFRTVTDQADGMMSSLEKAVNRCQVRILIGHATRVLTARPLGIHLASAQTWCGRFPNPPAFSAVILQSRSLHDQFGSI
jgi:hypothetical protein